MRLVREHPAEYETPWAAIRSVAEKLGCSAEALRRTASAHVAQAALDRRTP